MKGYNRVAHYIPEGLEAGYKTLPSNLVSLSRENGQIVLNFSPPGLALTTPELGWKTALDTFGFWVHISWSAQQHANTQLANVISWNFKLQCRCLAFFIWLACRGEDQQQIPE